MPRRIVCVNTHGHLWRRVPGQVLNLLEVQPLLKELSDEGVPKLMRVAPEVQHDTNVSVPITETARHPAPFDRTALHDPPTLLRQSAQATQAAKILQQLTPESRLYAIQKAVRQMNERAGKDGGFDPETGEFNGVAIDPALIERFLKAKSDEERIPKFS